MTPPNRPTNQSYKRTRRPVESAMDEYFGGRAPEARQYLLDVEGPTANTNWAGHDSGSIQFAALDGGPITAFEATIQVTNHPGRFGQDTSGFPLEGSETTINDADWVDFAAAISDLGITQITGRFNRLRVLVTIADPNVVAWVL